MAPLVLLPLDSSTSAKVKENPGKTQHNDDMTSVPKHKSGAIYTLDRPLKNAHIKPQIIN